MPQEDVTLKFASAGARETSRDLDEVTKKVRLLHSAFSDLGGKSNASVAFVQSMHKGMSEAKESLNGVGTATGRIGHGMTSMSHQVRAGAHIITGTFGQMAGAVSPVLGNMVGSLRLGAQTFSAMGGAVAGAVVGMEVASVVISSFVKKIQEAEQWQTKLNLAFRQADAGALKSMMSEIDAAEAKLANAGFLSRLSMYWTEETDPKVWNERRRKLTEQMNLLYKVFEKPKAQSEIRTAGLELDRQSLDIAMKSAQSAGDRQAILAKQLDIAKQLAKQAEDDAVREATQKNLTEGGTDEQKLDRIADARAKAQIEGRKKVQGEEFRIGNETENFNKSRMQDALSATKEFVDTRIAILQAERDERLRFIETYTTDEQTRATMAETTKTDAARREGALRLAVIQQEIDAQKTLAAQHLDSAEIQQQTAMRINSLNSERVKTEIDVNNQIVGARKEMVDKLRNLEAEKASIGAGLLGKARASLVTRGAKAITADMERAEAERLMQWGEYYSAIRQGGGALTPEQIQFSQEMGGFSGRINKAGPRPGIWSTTESTFSAIQQEGAQYGQRVAPEDMVTPVTGDRDLAQLAQVGPKTDVIVQAFNDAFGKIPESFDAVMTGIKEKVEKGWTPVENLLIVKVVDGIMRKLSFDSARE